MAGHGSQGEARRGCCKFWPGGARLGMAGVVSRDEPRRGKAGLGRRDWARLGGEWRGAAWPAGLYKVGQGGAWHGQERHGLAWPATLVEARPGEARRRMMRRGLGRQRHGEAGRG